jgi:predicted NodU family carbamoyl transferase
MVEYSEPKRSMALQLLRMLIPAVNWRTTDHHWAHAHLALYDSPFDTPLIVSIDGGGSDGVFNIYSADRQQLRPIREVRRRHQLCRRHAYVLSQVYGVNDVVTGSSVRY